jgi:hypothetical protein
LTIFILRLILRLRLTLSKMEDEIEVGNADETQAGDCEEVVE